MAYLFDPLKFLDLMATHPNPPDESPAQAQQRLKHLTRSANDVYRKILKAYDIAPELPSDKQARLDEAAKTIAQQWTLEPGDAPTRESWSLEEVREAITTAAQEYFKAFTLDGALREERKTHPDYEHYRSDKTAFCLFDIYANHVTNAAEARLIGYGFNPLAAHRINGYIIRTTLDVAKQEINEDAFLAPQQLHPKHDLMAAEQVDCLRNYWRRRARELPRTLNGGPKL